MCLHTVRIAEYLKYSEICYKKPELLLQIPETRQRVRAFCKCTSSVTTRIFSLLLVMYYSLALSKTRCSSQVENCCFKIDWWREYDEQKRSDGHGYSCQGNFMTKDIPSCYGASTFVKFGEVCKLLSCLESIQQEMSSEYAYQLSAAFWRCRSTAEENCDRKSNCCAVATAEENCCAVQNSFEF